MVAIETGYRRRNSFRVGRRSFVFATLARLAPNGKERATTAKPRRRMINYSRFMLKESPAILVGSKSPFFRFKSKDNPVLKYDAQLDNIVSVVV
ncbi:hypothetical protein AVEN_137943-1 [Araneus ventricosus]|uniref:Uncharacterized protein n=1 Tax=Araneus ventricosus TaxID=182803 RepID=A0A4Y2GVG2_ARAVE|nr:hypothetical protein AVEN_137943-1 [Araneus ventricosus]